MNLRHRTVANPTPVKVAAAVIVGASLGTLVSPTPVTVPVVGAMPGYLLGGVGLVVGGALYRWIPPLLGDPGCGCEGSCGCS